jgi:hypothetical protein
MVNKNVFKEVENEIISLNEPLYDEFYVQELESRLETDPLIGGGLIDLFSSNESAAAPGCVVYCGSDGGCGEDCFIYW